jgi:hypothetical protein
MSSLEWPTSLYFQSENMQQRLHRYFPECLGDSLQFPEASNSELPSGLGHWTLDSGLWRINLRRDNQQIHQPVANNVYELRSTGALVHFLHKALFSPTKSALLQAVKDGYLIAWPGLAETTIHKHLKLTPATTMGHMNQRRQNIRSTSKAPIAEVLPTDTDLGTKTHLVSAVLVDQGQLYTDLTGKSRSDPAKETHMSWSAMFMTAMTLKSSR